MTPYKYLRGSRDSREVVEYEISRRGQYITTCVVNVDLLLCGIKVFPCGNGDDVRLTPEQQVEILELVQAERRKITDRYPVKTYEGWHQSGLPTFEDYCFPGDTVDEEMVEYFVNSVPPVLLRASCTQAGEPHSHEQDERGSHRPTYITFHDLGGGCWQFDGYCFEGENTNRVEKTYRQQRFEKRLAEARREAEQHG